jgi:hypothetical protein
MGVAFIPAAWPTRPAWALPPAETPRSLAGFPAHAGRVWQRRWRDAAAHLLLLAGAAALMYPALASGLIRWQEDTKYFYFPFLSALGAALKTGRLPLWEPGIFGGYPLFADGESGMLYPPHLVLLRLLDPAAALVALRLLRFYLAGAFTYAYLRSCTCVRVAAVCGGLAFACSGFMVGQVVHENLDSGMVWLPLALCFVERAVRERGRQRLTLAAFAGVALAMQALAVHVQVCVFSALAVFPYFGWRLLFADGEARFKRLAQGAIAVLVTGTVAAGLSAAQVLPLLDMALGSARGNGITLSAATINSVSPFRLATVVFPHLLRRSDGTPFGRWVDWEVTVYVGVPVLLLGLCAVLLRRDRYALFFGALAALSLCLSMGRYGPPWVVVVTQDLLGSHGLRSPGRFAFLWSFGMAALAGFGLDWLSRTRHSSKQEWQLARLVGRTWGALVITLLVVASTGLLYLAQTARTWLQTHPAEAANWVEQHYIGFDRAVPPKGDAQVIVRGLLRSLDPHSQTMACWVAGVTGGAALLLAWYLAREVRASWTRHPLVRGALGVASVLVVAGPLALVAARAHPANAASAIEPRSPAAGYLHEQLASPGGSTSGAYTAGCTGCTGNAASTPLYRVYTGQAVYLGKSDVEPNVLLPLGVQEAGGYSSLSTERYMAYAWAVEGTWHRMLDVWNARFFLTPNAAESLPSHELTSYHPQRPLVSGTGANAGARAWFHVQPTLAENVRVIATLRDAWDAKPGEVAGWVVAEDDQGERYQWPLRVGLEIAEATAPDPAMREARPPELVDAPEFPLAVRTWKEYGADGNPFDVSLYYTKLALPEDRTIVRLGIQAAVIPGAPLAILRVYGLGLGQPDWSVSNVLWTDREGLTQVFQDTQTRVFRNDNALPRAYLVPMGSALPEALHVKQMAERGFDPERMVLLDKAELAYAAARGQLPVAPWEDMAIASWFTAPDAPLPPEERLVTALDDGGRVTRSPAGTVHVLRDAGENVALRVDAAAPAWLFLSETYDPAWKATVDGTQAHIFLANGMFRAVAVPAGVHTVELRYAPAALERGAAISLATGLVVLAAALLGLMGRLRTRRASGRITEST